ncbi:ABC transporter permease [Desulfurispora thermophila]|uniref:ABC transporter permease n=1 Tax=Desulfurispora thermophila TaxID=265470 RepID=UPI000382DAC1|nr:ABC transporter permease [Desulfurispora thermophila]
MNGAALESAAARRLSLRGQLVLVLGGIVLLVLTVLVAGHLLGEAGTVTQLAVRNRPPSLQYPFGTDWLGRDMLARTLQGLTLSLKVGLLAATVSSLLALGLGLAAATLGRVVDSAISWLVDLFLSLPHLLLIIMIAFTLGGGTRGVIVAIALTHWPALTRVIRAEALQVCSTEYVQLAYRLGRSRYRVALEHILPHVLPQLLVGLVLLFPHAILHEASITFLGFGLSPHRPAIGVILSESMRFLASGQWWLAFFPGLALLVMLRAFDMLGEALRALLSPRTAQM